MTLGKLIRTEIDNDTKFNFCIYIKDLKYDIITTVIKISFSDLRKILGIFIMSKEIESLEQFENGIIYIKLKDS